MELTPGCPFFEDVQTALEAALLRLCKERSLALTFNGSQVSFFRVLVCCERPGSRGAVITVPWPDRETVCAKTPGEGEAKIAMYLKQHKTASAVIVSQDGDCIPLNLAILHCDITLLHSTPSDKGASSPCCASVPKCALSDACVCCAANAGWVFEAVSLATIREALAAVYQGAPLATRLC